MLTGIPTGAEAQLHPATAHLIDLRDAQRERPGKTERGRGDERAQPDRRCLSGQPGQGDPRVGGPRARVTLADAHVVVGTEERLETKRFGGPRDAKQIVVARALLGLGEDSQLHGSHHPATVYPVTSCSLPTKPRQDLLRCRWVYVM